MKIGAMRLDDEGSMVMIMEDFCYERDEVVM